MKASMHKSLVLFFALMLAVGLVGAWFVLLPGIARAATFTVTLTGDNTVFPYTAGELRWAIDQANTAPGADIIDFNIPGPGPHTISPAAVLPSITDQLLIDGYSQPGSLPANGGPAIIMIELDGTGGGSNGLQFVAGSNNSRVKGLAINRFTNNGVYIDNATGIQVDGNYLGTDVTGTVALANGNHGVLLSNNANTNTIGGTTPAERNVISGNVGDGVNISNSSGNDVQGN